MTQLSTVLYTN